MSDSYVFAEPVALAGESLRPEPLPEPVPEDRRVGLASPSFLGLLTTQFLVALNDNMFRWLVVPIGKDLAGEGNEGLVLSVGLACFVLPYLLLAAPAGWLADRFSKRSVIVRCKLAEFAIMVAGIEAILIGNLYLMFVVVALMGAQSALFSPSKLGAIPELVRENRIAAANGLFGLTTVVAIVGGTVSGNWLYALTTPSGTAFPPGHYRWWISAAALVGVAAVGFVASLVIGRLRPANPTRPFPANAPVETFRDLARLAAQRPPSQRSGRDLPRPGAARRPAPAAPGRPGQRVLLVAGLAGPIEHRPVRHQGPVRRAAGRRHTVGNVDPGRGVG